MSVSKIGINEEGNQANHQRQHQGILCPVKIAPTSLYSEISLGGNNCVRIYFQISLKDGITRKNL
jgi:hypothetical protein